MLKRLLSTLIVLAMIASSVITVAAVDAPKFICDDYSSAVSVSGNLPAEYNTSNVSILLIKKSASFSDVAASDIGYIQQTTVDNAGNYNVKFNFSKNIDDYKLYVRQGKNNVNPSVTKAEAISDLIDIDLKLDNISTASIGNAVLEVKNHFGKTGLSYDMYLAFYDVNGNLLDVSTAFNNSVIGGTASKNIEYDIPDNAAIVKAFIWNKISDLMPLKDVTVKDTDDYTFSDGDRIVMIGDSITHQSLYVKYLEHFYQTRYPDREISFINAGISGDKTAGIIGRFDWDIVPKNATHITILIGVNDMQGGASIDDTISRLRQIIETAKGKGITVTVLGGVMYDVDSSYTTQGISVSGIDKKLNNYIKACKVLAEELKVNYIELNDYLIDITERTREANPGAMVIMSADRIHPSDAGGFVMAELIAKQQGFDKYVSNIEIDVDSNAIVTSHNAETTLNNANSTSVSYEYKANAVPFATNDSYNVASGGDSSSNKVTGGFVGINVTDELNNEIIKVTGLEDGEYTIAFDGNVVTTATSDELAEGVNIATLATNPGQKKAQNVLKYDESKFTHAQHLRAYAFSKYYAYNNNVDPFDIDAFHAYLDDYIANGTQAHIRYYFGLYRDYYYGKEDVVRDNIIKYTDLAREAAQPERYTVTITKN